MKKIVLKKGLTLPITGSPKQIIQPSKQTKTVALLGKDYVGMKPTMLVKVGDVVKLGQPLFEDKKNPGVIFTSPASGKVLSVNRGEKRVFLSVVIECSGSDAVNFDIISPEDFSSKSEKIRKILIDSGLWTAFRQRPFSSIPAIDAKVPSIFVNAMDTNPLAACPSLVINENKEDFDNGLKALAALAMKRVAVCVSAEPPKIGVVDHDKVERYEFAGPHPAGLVGTHIHFIEPVSEKKSVWHIGYQDVIAIGKLLSTGHIWTERVISLAGPQVKKPGLLRTQLGANIAEITEGELAEGGNRIISGSVFSGDIANDGAQGFLGRYHNQVSVIEEDVERIFMGWHTPGFDKFSVKNVFASKLFPFKKFNFTSTTHGSHRALVPIGMYEKVMPLDIVATAFLKALLSNDLEGSVALGALELDEEDVGLFSFVCPGKTEYGPLLRHLLTTINKEG